MEDISISRITPITSYQKLTASWKTFHSTFSNFPQATNIVLYSKFPPNNAQMPRRWEPTDPNIPRPDFQTKADDKRADAEHIYLNGGTARDVKEFFVREWGCHSMTPLSSFERQLDRWDLKKRGTPDLSTLPEAPFIDLTLVQSETPHGQYPSSSSFQSVVPTLPQQGSGGRGLVDYTSRTTPSFRQAIPPSQSRPSSTRPEDWSRSSTPAVQQFRESSYPSRALSRLQTPFVDGRNRTPSAVVPPPRPASTMPASSRSQTPTINRSRTPAIDNSRRSYGDYRNMYIPPRGPIGQATDYSALPPPRPGYEAPAYPFNREALSSYQAEENTQFNDAFDLTLASRETSSEFIDDEFCRLMQRDEVPVRRSRHSDGKKRDNPRSGRDTPRR